jgi:hypothetical protein
VVERAATLSQHGMPHARDFQYRHEREL